MAVTSRIGVVGSGQVGSKLGGQLLAKGYKVTYSSRDPTSDKIKQLLAQQPTAKVDTVTNVVASSDVLILATPGPHQDDGIKAMAASLGDGIKGKVLLDATNPLTAPLALEVRWEQGTSGGEVLAAALPDTYVFKAFNTVGDNLMDQGEGEGFGQQLTMLFAGPEEKKDVAAQVIEGVGFAPAYVGPIRYARNLEAIAELWTHLGDAAYGLTKECWGRDFNIQVLKKAA